MSLPSYAMNQSSFPEMYEQFLVAPLFRPWAERILDELKPGPGDRLLDIACGTGIVARVARERMGPAARIVGIDISADMIAVARRIAPEIDWREGNAAALPLREGEQFDFVVCHQGLQFFPDKKAAAAEMRRALAPGGKLAVATWRPVDEVPFFRDLTHVGERHLGPIVDQRHSFGDAAALEAVLREAGFRDVQSRTQAHTHRFEDGAPLLRMNAMALVGMSAAGKGMAPEERQRMAETIAAESAEAVRPFAGGPGLVFELRTNLATASR